MMKCRVLMVYFIGAGGLFCAQAVAIEPYQIAQEQPLIPVIDVENLPEKKLPPSDNDTKPETDNSKPVDESSTLVTEPEKEPVSTDNKKAEPVPAKSEEGMESLLFSESDIQSLRSARAFYERSQSGKGNGEFSEDDFLKKLENAANAKLGNNDEFVYPQFFLSSLIYRSAGDWVVWVNNEKFTHKNTVSASGLSVVGVDREKVSFEWKPERTDKIVDTTDYFTNSAVKVDMADKIVKFTLKPNQTFTSYAMKVVEGRVAPIADVQNPVAQNR